MTEELHELLEELDIYDTCDFEDKTHTNKIIKEIDRRLKFLDSMKDVNLCCIYCRRVIRCYNEVNE